MGCKSSKSVANAQAKRHANARPDPRSNSTGSNNINGRPASTRNTSMLAPQRCTTAHIGEGTPKQANFSTTAPVKAPSRTNTTLQTENVAATDIDENGNVVLLPKGTWIKTEGTPYYYSALENLYYHPPSRQFYDPNNEMWYDSDTNEWYRDDDDDAQSSNVRAVAAR